jgi:Mor family transcriptional regulator
MKLRYETGRFDDMSRNVTTSARNRALIAAYEAGAGIEQLVQCYGISAKRVRAIIADEQNRRRVSREPFYLNFRVNRNQGV